MRRGAVRPAISTGLILSFWWLSGHAQLVNPVFLPPVEEVFSAMWRLFKELAIFRDIAATVWRATAGVTLAVVVGVPLGILFGRKPKLYEFFELPVDFFRSVPSSALFFLFILVFGIGDGAKIAVVFYGCSLIMLVSAVYGARDTKEKIARRDTLRVFGASQWQQMVWVTFPDALPHIASAIRVSASLALVLVVVTEMFLASESGIGRRIYDFYLGYRIAEMYASIILLGFVGFLANRVLVAWEARTALWSSD